MQSFLGLSEDQFAGANVIIDVDGTLTYDKNSSLEPDVVEKVKRIAGRAASVTLFSNGAHSHAELFAHECGVNFVASKHRKPSRRVMERFDGLQHRMMVIGDKALTDGLFAANIGAQFIPVAHVRHDDDSARVRATYFLDDIVRVFVKIAAPILPYASLMRPYQWVKNVLVFAPVFFAAEAFNVHDLVQASFAALAFCATSSAMYVFNDIVDAKTDRAHPTKRWRPIASGAATVSGAIALLVLLAIADVVLLSHIPAAAYVIAAYAVGNIAYSLFLKHVAVVDIMFVALFYVARVIAGGAATGLYISPWIVLCVLFGALFLVIGKRRAESLRVSRRRVLEQYSTAALDHLLTGSAVLAITSYGLYSVLAAHSLYAVYSTIFVFTAIVRVVNRQYLSDGNAEYPETLVFKDKWVLLIVALWALYMGTLLYM